MGMKAGETWDVPGVALARSTGSANSIGPGILFLLSEIDMEGAAAGKCMVFRDIHEELVGRLLEFLGAHCRGSFSIREVTKRRDGTTTVGKQR